MDERNELGRIVAGARVAERRAAPWVERLARLGYAAKGAVYILVGGIAARAAFGGGGDVEGSTGALESLRDEPLGQTLLWLMGIGLAGYAVWRAIATVRNPENDEPGKRAFHGLSALIHAALALEAMRLASGNGAGGGEHWSATLMAQPFGRLLTGIAAVLIAGYGLQQIWRGWSVDLGRRLDLGSLSASARAWVVRIGRAGLAARGIVLGVLGYILLDAAIEADASDARGVEGVLESMRDRPWLLGIVALGLVAYGLFSLVQARYRRIRTA